MASNGNDIPIRGAGATVPFFIQGKDVISSKTFDVISPATGKTVHKCSSATEADAQAAVDAAVAAFPAWKAVTPGKRRDVFLRAAEVMERRREELVTVMMEEIGAPRAWADFNITTAKEFLIDIAGRLVTIEGAIPTTQDPNTGALVLKEPFGVIFAIAPW